MQWKITLLIYYSIVKLYQSMTWKDLKCLLQCKNELMNELNKWVTWLPAHEMKEICLLLLYKSKNKNSSVLSKPIQSMPYFQPLTRTLEIFWLDWGLVSLKILNLNETIILKVGVPERTGLSRVASDLYYLDTVKRLFCLCIVYVVSLVQLFLQTLHSRYTPHRWKRAFSHVVDNSSSNALRKCTISQP